MLKYNTYIDTISKLLFLSYFNYDDEEDEDEDEEEEEEEDESNTRRELWRFWVRRNKILTQERGK